MATADPFDVNVMLSPGKYGFKQCDNCNGYGSCLKEASPKCTVCGGSGLVKLEAKREK